MVKRKKVLAVLTALVACTSFSVFAAAPYTDLGGLKSRVAIDYLYDNNCLSFAPGTTFSPQQVLTRGDLAQLIYGTALNLPTAPLNFTDAMVSPSSSISIEREHTPLVLYTVMIYSSIRIICG